MIAETKVDIGIITAKTTIGTGLSATISFHPINKLYI
jgi:hypothetical protein